MNSTRALQNIGFVLVLAAIPVLAGCNAALVGTWKADPIPEDADFYIANATFNDNDTFRAMARRKGAEPQSLRGKYEFNGFKLTLHKAGKSKREYNATYNMFTKTLEISKEDSKQTLKKQ